MLFKRIRNPLTFIFFLITVISALAEQRCASNSSQAVLDARIDQAIARMTLGEKVAQLQDRAPALPQLGLPGYNWWNEGLHGVARNGFATVFPQAIGLAATWDPALMQRVGNVVATEARAKFNAHAHDGSPRYGGLTIWSPNINIFRDPRWGRGQETYGEDPYLTATMALPFVHGIQGDDAFYLKADATPKHFAVHSGPERGRDSFDSHATMHDLEDTYFPAFHAVLGTGRAAAVMCSYNDINGVPSCASRANIQGTVRDRWGFGGYVVSDCGAVGDISEYHHYATDSAHAAADALNAGVDLECGSTYATLTNSVQQHLTTEGDVNRSLHRLLAARAHLGMLDASDCSPYAKIRPSAVDTPENSALATRAAEESMVLLKNDKVLPLRKEQRIAVIGATADMVKILEANYHGTASHPITLLDGLREEAQVVAYAQGSLLADNLPVVIPSNAWHTDGALGVKAEYFNSAELKGVPAATRVVTKIDEDINRAPFDSSQTGETFSTRWRGQLLPPAPGNYALRVNVERCWDCHQHDTFRLLVDGHTVIDNHGAQGETDRTTLHFDTTAPHAVELVYCHTGEDEGVALEWVPPATAELDEAVRAAQSAEVLVVFAGLSPDLEGEALQVDLPGFDGGDRTSLALPETQRKLLDRLNTLGKPIVLVLTSGSAIALGQQAKNVRAIVEAWYPGEAGGTALANLLLGKANFSGRLPVTFYRSADDLPPFPDYSMANRTYRYFGGAVEFPFGFGLSYSSFRYGPVRLSSRRPGNSDTLSASVVVRNTSTVEGSEVAELYLQPPQVQGAARIVLQGLHHISLAPGESRELTFKLDPQQRSIVTADGQRILPQGAYRVFIGGSQPELTRASAATFRQARPEALPPSKPSAPR